MFVTPGDKLGPIPKISRVWRLPRRVSNQWVSRQTDAFVLARTTMATMPWVQAQVRCPVARVVVKIRGHHQTSKNEIIPWELFFRGLTRVHLSTLEHLIHSHCDQEQGANLCCDQRCSSSRDY